MENKTELTPKIQAAVQTAKELLASLTSGQMAMVGAFADSHQKKADRLAAFEKDLIGERGSKDPEVLAVRKQKEQSARFATAMRTALKRVQLLTPPKSTEHGVVGTVRTNDGALAQGINVQLVSTTGKTHKKIAEVRTNEFGDFSLNLALCDVNPKASLSLVIQDEQGELLASQPVKIDPSRTGASFVPLTLQPPPEPATGTNPTAPVEEGEGYEAKPAEPEPAEPRTPRTGKTPPSDYSPKK